MRILCVDDDLTSRTILKNGLRKQCPPEDEILIADCGEKGLEMFNDHQVDVVITDLKMPGMSGLDLLKSIKQITPQAEVVVLTAHASINSVVEAMKAGARDYLEKPVNIPLLMEKISNVRYLINQKNELEEYRFAKEMIEDNASEDIARLELAINNFENQIENINNIINSSDSDSDKLKKIHTCLEEQVKG